MREFKDICYSEIDSSAAHQLDLYLPDAPSFPLFVYFHGGGLVKGSKSGFTKVAAWLVSQGVGVASVEYRMYPDAKYPDFLLDAAESIGYLRFHISEYGECTGFYVGGSSAGGYISMMLCFDDRWLSPYGIKPTDIDGFVHDAGQPTCHFNVLKYSGIDSRRVIIDETAPLYHVGVAPCYPRMYIIVSDHDMTNRLEQTSVLMTALRQFGYDMEKVSYTLMQGTHCAYCSRFTEQGESVFGRMILDFIRQKI